MDHLVHTFNPGTLKAEQADLSEFEASPVYRVSSRTLQSYRRNPVSKKENTRQDSAIWSGWKQMFHVHWPKSLMAVTVVYNKKKGQRSYQTDHTQG